MTVSSDHRAPSRDLVLLDLLDRALDKGVVISGDLIISVADVDLIYVGLNVLLSSVERLEQMRSHAVAAPVNEPVS